MDEHERSLKELFNSAKRQITKMDSSIPRSAEYERAQDTAMKKLEDCREVVTTIALYSKNETVDDVSTQNLQFLAVDYLLAEVKLKLYASDRLEQLRQISELLETFLTRLDHYGLLSANDRKLFDRYQQRRQHFSVIITTNPEDRRSQKISRFQYENALKSKLAALRNETTVSNVDDESIRKLYLTELALYVHETFQSMDLISQEISILSQAHNLEPQAALQDARNDRRQHQRTNEAYSDRLDGPVTLGGLAGAGGPLLSSKGKPLQPFTLLDKRTQLQQGVFRPGHSLPTMTIDEYLEEERKRGGIIEGGGNANAPQPEPDEDNIDQVDAATMKAREWDEFVEANPKGAGNTLNRG